MTVEAFLANPNQIDPNNHRDQEFLQNNRSRLEPELLQQSDSAEARQRLWLGILLLEMGAPSGSRLVLGSLADPDPHIVRSALLFCSSARWRKGEGLLVPLDEPAAAAAIQPFLSAADTVIRMSAAGALCRLSDAGSIQRLIRLLAHEDPRIRSQVAQSLALYHGNSQAWPIIRSLFTTAMPHEKYGLVNSLTGFANTGDQDVRDQVAAFARRELAALYNCEDNDAANEANNLLRLLDALAPQWKADVLIEVVASKMAAWVKAVAAERLVLEAEASTAERHVIAWLDQPELADSTFEIIHKMGAKANTPAIVSRLHMELGSGATGKRLEKLLDALTATGMEDADDLGSFTSQLAGWPQFDLVTRLKHVSADAMLVLLDRAELTAKASHDARTRFAEAWRKGDSFDTILELLVEGGRVHWFDCEDAHSPPDYLGLLAELLALSGGEIVVKNAVVSIKPPASLELRIDTNARAVKIDLQYQGDWIDVEGLVSGLNGLLAEMHSPRRYYPVAAVGQAAGLILAKVEAMVPLIQDFAFPIGDPGEARRLGQEYEAQTPGWGARNLSAPGS